MSKGRPKASIRDVSVRFLSYRDRSEAEMKKHLAGKGFSDEEVENEMAELKELGMVDDLRFGASYLRYGGQAGRGLLRLRRELADKGLSANDIEDAIYAYQQEEEIDLAEEDRRRARELSETFMAGKDRDQKTLARLSRKLKTLGYDSDIIYEIVGGYMRESQ